MPAPRLSILCAVALSLAAGTLSADIVYIGDTYSGNSNIMRFDTEGTDPNPTSLIGPETGVVQSIYADPANNRMYWACDLVGVGDSYVRTANLDATVLETMTEPQNIWRMTADPTGGYLYYGHSPEYGSATPGLSRRELDGSNQQLIAAANQYVYAVAVDASAGKLYWGQNYSGSTIWQADLDGGNPVELFSGYTYVRDMDVDEARGLLYWLANDVIYRAPLDGSWSPVAILDTMDAQCLALSPDGDTVYFAGDDDGDLYRMDADGGNVTWVTGVYNAVALEVIPEPASLALLSLGGLALIRRRSKTA